MAGKKRVFACATDIKSITELECFFDLLGSVIIVLDKKANILLFNSGAEEILGYKAEKVLGKNWIDNFLPKEIVPTIKIVFKNMITGKTPFIEKYVNELVRKDGKRLSFQWHSSAIKDEKGSIQGIIASAVDITSMVEAENKLQIKLDELEKLNNLMIGRELKMIQLKEELRKYEAN